MSRQRLVVRAIAATVLGTSLLLGAAEWLSQPAAAEAKKQTPLATRSSPIAVTHDDDYVWSVNPDNDSVSVFKVRDDENTRIAEIGVGKEPWCVAITPDDERAYVTNMASGTVSVVSTFHRKVIDTIKVGSEPFGCALTPDGRRLYVANQSSDTVSVISTRSNEVIDTIRNVGVKPHGIAISADGTRVFVTQFLALKRAGDPRPSTRSEGADDGREGRITVISAPGNHVIGTVRLAPLPDTGFLSGGNTLAREPLTAVFDNVTGAFPNLLESITIKDGRAYIPGTCSSPNGPFRFNVNVQSCLSTIDIEQNLEAFKTLNMNVGVQFEPVGRKLFNTNPFAVAFKSSADEGFIALAATNRLLRVTLNDNGAPTINPPANAADPGNIVRIELKDPADIGQADPDDTIGGKNPRGIVLNANRHSRLRDGLPLARHRRRRRVGKRPDSVQDAGPRPVGRPAGGQHGCRHRAPGQVPVQHGDRSGRDAAEFGPAVRQDVRHRLGHVLQLSSERPHRHGDVDVRGRPAPGDLDGEHVRVRRRRRSSTAHRRCRTRTSGRSTGRRSGTKSRTSPVTFVPSRVAPG